MVLTKLLAWASELIVPVSSSKAAAKNDAVNFAFFQIDFIQIGNFVFAAG